jgi:sugar transferase (PEP-CTERM system associated)
MGMVIAGFVDDNPALVGISVVNPKVLGLTRDLEQIVAQNNVDRVVVELKDRRGRLPIQTLLEMKTRGIAIEDATSLYERVSGKIAIENLKPSWMIFDPGFDVSAGRLLQKRIFSLVISAVLLMLSAPITLLAMVLIKLDSRGPVFFGQERVGQDGLTFKLWKFRSMREDAEKETGPVWASLDDPRVTRVGRILRRMRLDELPQLFNVLRGDMSLVGPRPERPHFVHELAEKIPFYHLRHSVKPGVTGWAQISYHYGSSLNDAIEKLQYDLFYIRNMSWLLDTLIVFQTIKIVLFQRGS